MVMSNNVSNITFVKFSSLYNWDVKQFVESSSIYTDNFKIVPFKAFAQSANLNRIHIQDDEDYKILGVRSYGFGAYVNRKVKGKSLKMKIYQQVKPDHLYWCKVDTKNGAFGIITKEISDGVASSNMTLAELDLNVINPDFLQIFFKSKKFNEYMDSFVTGTTNRKYIRPSQIFEDIKIPLPPLNDEDAENKKVSNKITQKKLVDSYFQKLADAESAKIKAKITEKEIETYLNSELGINESLLESKTLGLSFVKFKDLYDWGIERNSGNLFNHSNKYPMISLGTRKDISIELFRGKSPKYEKSESKILNQKCIRWFDIDMQFAKTVNSSWLNNLDKKFFTQVGDVLINSTGDGTIGRSAIVTEKEKDFLYDSHILLVRLDQAKLNPMLFCLLFNSQFVQKQIEKIKSANSTKQTELGLENLKKIQFPFIEDIEHQKIIANQILSLQNKVKTLNNKANSLILDAIVDFEKTIFKN